MDQRYLCCKHERPHESGPSNGSDDHGDAAPCLKVREAQTPDFAKSGAMTCNQDAPGPLRPLTRPCFRCDAALHSGPSLRARNQSGGELVVCGLSGHSSRTGQRPVASPITTFIASADRPPPRPRNFCAAFPKPSIPRHAVEHGNPALLSQVSDGLTAVT